MKYFTRCENIFDLKMDVAPRKETSICRKQVNDTSLYGNCLERANIYTKIIFIATKYSRNHLCSTKTNSTDCIDRPSSPRA